MKKWVTKQNTKVYCLKTFRSHCYLIQKGDMYALVDTGGKLERRFICRQLEKMGIKRIAAILITHVHTDHVENAYYLQKKFHSKIYIDQLEFNELVKGHCYMPKGTNAYARMISDFAHYFDIGQHFEACKEAKSLRENSLKDIFGETIKWYNTPGHSKGSVTYIIDNEIAIVGDTMMNVGKDIYPPLADQPELLYDAWMFLKRKNVRVYLPGHGGPISSKQVDCDIKKIHR